MLLQSAKGVRGTVYDLETGKRIPKVIDLNLETGYLKAYYVIRQNDEHPEQEEIRKNEAGDYEWYEAKGQFRFVPNSGSPVRVSALGAPNCARCRSPLTLPGDDLCPPCRAAERLQPNRFRIERLTTPLFDRKCQECSRLAAWAVADEVDVTPEVGGRFYWERGMTVGRRYYCDNHYRPARLLDPKGEVVQDFRYAGPDLLGGNHDD